MFSSDVKILDSYNKVVKCFFLLVDEKKLAIEATEPGNK